MNKLVVFSLVAGDLEHGFPVVTAQLWDSNQAYPIKMTGSLPAAPEIIELYRRWQILYTALHHRLGWQQRIAVHTQQVTNVSVNDFGEVCQQLERCLNEWLNSEPFQKIERQLRTLLSQNDEIRIIFETNTGLLQRLPWHLWHLFADYPQAEVAVSLPEYARPSVSPHATTGKVKILAILGNSEGIEIEKDRLLLESLPDAQTTFIVAPDRQELNEQLWQQGWDILFFAGHSTSQTDDEAGLIYINQTESLTIPQLKHALSAAINGGLQLAIFNSCDGIGLARDLADLQIPQIIVMREPVPDTVAQQFLKHFLSAFAGGKSLYGAVREAREKLQGYENDFPCASWLPVICQNPTSVGATWQTLRGTSAQVTSSPKVKGWGSLQRVLLTSSVVAALVVGLRYLGLMQTTELHSYDQIIRLKSPEPQDTRLLVVAVTEADIQARSHETRRGTKSLSDKSLALLLQKISAFRPRAIGLDIYQDVADPESKLTTQLNQPHVFVVCKGRDKVVDPDGIAPPQGVPIEQQGFSDAVADQDGILRRQLLWMEQEASSPCTAPYALNLQLALQYLRQVGIQPEFTSDKNLKLGSTVFSRLQPGSSGGYQQVDLNGAQIVINYRSATFQEVTAGEVLAGRLNGELVKDRVVLIGLTANSSNDTWRTPDSVVNPVQPETPGVYLQAQMVSQILSAVLDKRPLVWVLPFWGESLWIWGWSVVSGVVVWRFGLRDRTHRTTLKQLSSIVATSVILYAVCAATLLVSGGWIPFIPTLVAIVVSSLVILNLPKLPTTTHKQPTKLSGNSL